MLAGEFSEIVLNEWLNECELVVEVDGKQYAAKKVETDKINGNRICILMAEEK